jgi:hypothetical protein
MVVAMTLHTYWLAVPLTLVVLGCIAPVMSLWLVGPGE